MKSFLKNKILWIAALGYFVDLYDLVLYGVVRVQSLKALHVPESEFFAIGASLLNYQMSGMLLGGLVWGILGDKKGRRTALFGSIFLYSLATFLNAFVQTVPQYAFLRFMAGLGLAGELGAAITLVSESLPQQTRGLGAAMVASIGFLGAALSSFVSQKMSWQHAYLSGGALGVALLFTRMSISESTIYTHSRLSKTETHWGSLKLFFTSSKRSLKLLCCLLVGIPIWYVAGILSYFAPEFAKAYHIQGEVTAGTCIMVGYLGAILGDIACGFLSHFLKSRKKAVLIFLSLGGFIALTHGLWIENGSAAIFYSTRFAIGFGNGYIAVLVAWIAEIFGTNLRATTTTLVPNLIRAAVIPLIFVLNKLVPHFGLLHSSIIIGVSCFSAAIIASFFLEETFHRDINFIEN